MPINDTDLLLVNRLNTNYQVKAKNLMATIEDDDLLIVSRGGVPYKATGAEIKDSLGSPAINPGLNDITLDPSTPGSGTEADPYILQTQTVGPYGSTTQSVETITIVGQPPEAQVVWKDSSVDAGSRFAQVSGELTDASGVWTGQLEYADIPDSTEDTTYVGKLSIGLVYFQWTIAQLDVATAPPAITSVSLVEADPEGPRFTSQSFVASSQVVDGLPISTKTIDAHVDGTLSRTVQFDEPLESSGAIDGAWTTASATEANKWYSVTYGELPDGTKRFVAVAFDGTNRVMYSDDDGLTWKNDNLTGVEAKGWYSVTYGNGKFVAVEVDGTNRVMHSTNGINWTAVSSVDGAWWSVTYGNGKFVAVSNNAANRVMYSEDDGLTWKDDNVTGTEANNWYSVTYGNGKFVAVANSGTNRVMHSTDGISWNSASAAQASDWNSVTYGELPNGTKRFVAVAYSNTNRVMYSDDDGITWTSASATEPNGWFSVTYGNGKFVAVAFSGENRVMHSTDGISWTPASATEANEWRSVTYSGGKFVAVASDGNNRVVWSYTGTGEDATDLTFAADADMEGLAAGDTVNQTNNFTEPLESSSTTTTPDQNKSQLIPPLTPVYNSDLRYFFSEFDRDAFPGTYHTATPTGARCILTTPIENVKTMHLVWGNSSYQSQYWTHWVRVGAADPWIQCTPPWAVPDRTQQKIDWSSAFDVSSQIPSNGIITEFEFGLSRNDGLNGQSAQMWWGGLVINGETVISSQTRVNLTFANGTDMTTLEAGDAVSQVGGPNYKERTNYNDGAITLTEPEIDKFFDGNIDTYMVSLAGAWTAGGGNINIDLSTAPITDVKEVKFSFNKALLDDGLMTPTLIYNSTSQGSIINFPRVDTGTHYVTTFTPGNAPLTQIGFYLVLEAAVNTDWETTSGIQVVKNDGTVEWLTSGGPTGTVGSITDTTATLSSSSGTWVDGQDVTTGDKTTTGTVAGVSDTTATLSSSSGAWVNGLDVTGPQKTIVEDNTRLYCAFDSNGNISDLQNNPQDPPYTTTDSNPGLTLTFPATFSSGQTPDEELPDGTTFTVEVTATNAASTDSKEATVQPEPGSPAFPLAGLTTLYPGNGTSRTITNGIDLADDGGLVWIKSRNTGHYNVLTDTVRGPMKSLYSNDAMKEDSAAQALTSFNDKGFTVGNGSDVNGIGDLQNYVAWTFGKAAGYFDVVQFTASSANPFQAIPHSLGTKPGFIITKQLDGAGNWSCYHSAIGDGGYINLNQGGAKDTYDSWRTSDTDFQISSSGFYGNGAEIVAYLFAEDTPGVIKCGTFSGQGAVDVGFEPQWVLCKAADNDADWYIIDNKRDGRTQVHSAALFPNDNRTESTGYDWQFTSTGWTQTSVGYPNQIYVAIAAPPAARSQTAEEFIDTQLNFLTYNNRKQCYEGEQAEANKAALRNSLLEQGFDQTEVTTLLPINLY